VIAKERRMSAARDRPRTFGQDLYYPQSTSVTIRRTQSATALGEITLMATGFPAQFSKGRRRKRKTGFAR